MTNVVNDLPFGTGVDAAYTALIVVPAADGGWPTRRFELIVEVKDKFVTSNGDVTETLAEAATELANEFSSPGRAAEVIVLATGALVAVAA